MSYELHLLGVVLVAGLGFGLATSGWLTLLAAVLAQRNK